MLTCAPLNAHPSRCSTLPACLFYRQFGADRNEMRAQLNEAWPIHLFPQLNVLPDGTVAASAGKTLVNYKRTGEHEFVNKTSRFLVWARITGCRGAVELDLCKGDTVVKKVSMQGRHVG